MEAATTQRAVAKTNCNNNSSRSHTVFQIYIEGDNRKLNQTVSSMLSLVDLAGSERLDSSKASGQQLKETQAINASLSSLVSCITAIGNNNIHCYASIPFVYCIGFYLCLHN